MPFLSEFKKFAIRGNVIDLAVGVVIGGAFGKIVSSLVSDVFIPIIGLLIGGVNFQKWAITLKHATIDAAGKEVPAVTLGIGNFIQTTFDFIIIAFAIFLFVKAVNKLSQKKDETLTIPPTPTKEEQLLTEIRDILKNQK
ncbi:MAG: large-conductance mechanosensitive channel protein MscL [Prevotellaceae bacterium]|jgi:large conductance mechanosensitive channel|nr:large-conductance mechanosensitive channel protein MscL [Prevotellaceae bacterium]